MDNKVFYNINNNSLNLTYKIIDILIAVIFFVLVFGLIYKAFLFSIRTIKLIITTLFGGIITKKEDYDSYENNLSKEARKSRKTCFLENDIQNDLPKLQIESNKEKTFKEIMDKKNNDE